ncbi:carboxymuconolactone decarboxylase family protein [Frankia sp. AgB1.9]|uniref:carboxymuconolactone decarboxylase family protein n=1 Tax=unclassified Frankia TaxID=2632575 RepID=UPI001934B418|nr:MULTISPECIES: carboxymuconolactone decarboxylase family protein [unclassified Frankia]MBL7487240.1 carboxymuconolactone decarboxylase family protein [Frankia sp. AgW1.1]MBL7547986.1 carboxymuconolactone decarboxylase family protein [Frankia sp. AgB1.9]MBL7625021.1 carboxymuconolactone decarboxylase family protein [Frankia sp. AgB1.8]
MSRVDPIPPRAWPKEMRGALAALMPPAPRHPPPSPEGRPIPLNMLGTFAHHPGLARAFFTFNGHMLLATTLSQRQREILILRVAKLRQSAYAWAEHLGMGREAGLSDEEIGQIAWGPNAPHWDPLEAALLRATDELVADGEISHDTWTILSATLDTQQLMDVIFTVGAYEILSWMFRSLDLDLDGDLQ